MQKPPKYAKISDQILLFYQSIENSMMVTVYNSYCAANSIIPLSLNGEEDINN